MDILDDKCLRRKDMVYLRSFKYASPGPSVALIAHSPPAALCGATYGQIHCMVLKYGLSEVNMLNIFSLVSPDVSSIGGGGGDWTKWTDKLNDRIISKVCARVDFVVCCWGVERLYYRPAEVSKLLTAVGCRSIKCFNKSSKSGRPYHYRGWRAPNLPLDLPSWPNY